VPFQQVVATTAEKTKGELGLKYEMKNIKETYAKYQGR